MTATAAEIDERAAAPGLAVIEDNPDRSNGAPAPRTWGLYWTTDLFVVAPHVERMATLDDVTAAVAALETQADSGALPRPRTDTLKQSYAGLSGRLVVNRQDGQ